MLGNYPSHLESDGTLKRGLLLTFEFRPTLLHSLIHLTALPPTKDKGEGAGEFLLQSPEDSGMSCVSDVDVPTYLHLWYLYVDSIVLKVVNSEHILQGSSYLCF